MFAVLFNCATVLVGSFLGILLKARLSQKSREAIFTAIGVFTLVIGAQMAQTMQRVIFNLLALVVGGIIGYACNVEKGITNFGSGLRVLVSKKNQSADSRSGNDFANAFLNASVLFCVGSMAIVGSVTAGASGDYNLLLTKSTIDGFAALALAASQGAGVAFSVISILIYQGSLVLFASRLEYLISDIMISELTSVGGMLIMLIGVNLLKLKEVRTANFLPSLIMIIVFTACEPLLRPYAIAGYLLN